MKIIERQGKSKEEVINEVLKEMGVEKKNFIYSVDVLEKSKVKFLLFNNKKINVKVTILEEHEKQTIEFLKQLLQYMNINLNEIKLGEAVDNTLNLEIDTDDVGILIGRRGKTLESVQYLINLIFNKHREPKIKIILDVKNYREKRVQALQRLAQNSAFKVKKFKRDIILNPMNPYERKIIHTSLQEDQDVITESIGEGIYKQIRIKLKH